MTDKIYHEWCKDTKVSLCKRLMLSMANDLKRLTHFDDAYGFPRMLLFCRLSAQWVPSVAFPRFIAKRIAGKNINLPPPCFGRRTEF